MKCSRKISYQLWAWLGFALLVLYVRAASADVVYSDYIRLVNSYLPDCLNPDKILTPDLLTRIPATYLLRWLNVQLFGYSVQFDRLIGLLGLLAVALTLCGWLYRRGLPVWTAPCVCLLVCTLSQWEMLLNGSGYPHLLASGGFMLHYVLLDGLYRGEERRGERRLMLALPFVLTLGLAGPYAAAYTALLLLACLWLALLKPERRRFCLAQSLSALLPFALYMWSNHYAVYEHAGAVDLSFVQVLGEKPDFVLRFLLNGLASDVIGGESLQYLLARGWLSPGGVYLLGAAVLLVYMAAACCWLVCGLWREHLLPMLLLLGGGANHLLILLARYIFLKEQYAWASRYVLQYQLAVLGTCLIFLLAARRKSAAGTKYGGMRRFLLLIPLFFILGNCYTTYQELQKAPAREASYERMRAAALSYRQLDDKTLADTFEYRKGAEQIRAALRILEANQLNVFR